MELAITILVFALLGVFIRFLIYAIFESKYVRTIDAQTKQIEKLEDDLKWERRNNEKR